MALDGGASRTKKARSAARLATKPQRTSIRPSVVCALNLPTTTTTADNLYIPREYPRAALFLSLDIFLSTQQDVLHRSSRAYHRPFHTYTCTSYLENIHLQQYRRRVQEEG